VVVQRLVLEKKKFIPIEFHYQARKQDLKTLIQSRPSTFPKTFSLKYILTSSSHFLVDRVLVPCFGHMIFNHINPFTFSFIFSLFLYKNQKHANAHKYIASETLYFVCRKHIRCSNFHWMVAQMCTSLHSSPSVNNGEQTAGLLAANKHQSVVTTATRYIDSISRSTYSWWL
jgi:hypothetical protein